ncbi:hormogonium polysaccharide biosynthesis protein HpsA [Leptothoe kymatousa]|uniref:Uncharacterized protein n=1 Tax=Leptothoe kymatousa TAU-MAC 1615 TaxID=2364775 RepID=A0ABS5Y113_9CYAN|nr:hormogonium polysaccharide biosynthesis protein HpsA [Leptothoe kymatousa]MBT9311512.1 hypothetical protein [Leptothoe kymatousa TAU-MAC 1615]
MGRRNFNWQRIKQRPLNYFMSSVLRWLMLLSKTAKTSSAGFVLPTTVLLLLVVSLTMGALSFRSFSRVERTIAIRDQKIVDSFAAPAIDRAKAKLEYLFTQDDRVATKRPPSSDDLFQALTSQTASGSAVDPYTLPDETALDIDGNPGVDPAWSFEFEGNTVVYSLLVAHERPVLGGGTGTVSLSNDDASAKAEVLVTRNAPITTTDGGFGCAISRLAGDGWQEGPSNLQKNFQVNVLTIKGAGGPNKTVSAAEYQQVRSSPKGNKFGAYFRYDLDISPGDPFRWNGAMHSESNVIAGRNLQAYLVSSPESCIFSPDSSEITISESDFDGDGTGDYRGNLIAGVVRDNAFDIDDAVRFHTDAALDAAGNVTVTEVNFDETIDSVNASNNAQNLDDTYADPVQIFTEDVTKQLDGSTWTAVYPIGDTTKKLLDDRVLNKDDTTRPFLDDGYRADDRYGPKPRYNASKDLAGNLIGAQIPLSDVELTGFDKAAGEYGLDGYWERRSIAEGLRVIVGQRLELGNQFGWKGQEADPNDNDPLYPPATITELVRNNDGKRLKGPSEARQQKSLRDNLSAVQGMVAYHYSVNDGEIPYFCMASTVHPGTQQSLIDSRTFNNYPSPAARKEINFFTGHGTNGWEFNFPYTAGDYASGQPLGDALRNLKNFAGDPQGGAPSFTPVQGEQGQPDEFVHPYPYLAMWGDFSVLRRILDLGTPYSDLSPADKSTLDSTACTLGMLARNVEDLKEEYTAITSDGAVLDDIATALGTVTPGGQASEWLAPLPDPDDPLTTATDALLTRRARVLALYRQIVRDRRFGFLVPITNTCVAATDFANASAANQTKLMDAFCSTAQLPAYPSLYYVLPEFKHEQAGDDGTTGTAGYATFDTTQPAGEEYISEGGAATKYVFDTAVTTDVNNAVVYEAIDTSLLDLTPAASPNDFQQPTASGGGLVAPNDFASTTATDDEIRKSLTQSEIKDGATVYELAFLDKAMMDGRQQINVRVLDLDIGKLTLDKPAAFGKDSSGLDVTWIPEEEGLFYAAREDAVREDSVVRPRRDTWANCQNFANLQTGNCTMDIEPTQANQVGTYDPPLNSTNSISPKPVDMYPDPDRRPHGFRLVNGYNLNRSGDDKAAGISFITDNPAYIYGDFNLHQSYGTPVDPATGTPTVIEEFTTTLDTTFASYGTGNADRTAAKNLFYGRDTLDTRFADGDEDTWRAAEIFADSITILSNEFRDGWIEDAYIHGIGASVGVPKVASSYVNYNRSNKTADESPDRWLREDSIDAAQCDTATGGDCSLPIRFNRNGVSKGWKNSAATGLPAITCAASAFGDYPNCFNNDFIDVNDTSISKTAPNDIANAIKEERQKNQVTPPDNVRVNALLVAGIVPMRQNQTYGGIQNFPRLLEYWENKNLIISGGFFQLNFSTQATAPQDQDAWEPGAVPIAGLNKNPFYNPAKRIWGYDVAFQYTSVAPIAQRFVSVGRPRSEFYRELPLDDAYIQNLCAATDAGGNAVISCN